MKHPVDTSTWGEFKVGELFDVHPTKAYKLKNSDLLSVDGEIPVVVNSSYNNGIGGYSKLEPTEQPGVLTFSDTTSVSNSLFYQNQSFIGYAHVQGMYPKNFELTDLTALFMIATLRATIDQRKWDYTNKLNRTTVIEMRVKLPLKPTANPSDYTQEDIDWDYMESFMLRVQDAAKERLANLPEPGQKSKTPVDVSGWGEFKLVDIAKLTNGNKFDKNKMSRDNASINFVSRTGFNNGVSDFVDEIDGIEPYPEGAITLALGGSVGSTFVQTAPFYTGQNVGVIEFENKSFLAKQFVAAVLTKTCSIQFSAFKNEINKHFKRDLTIPLPLKSSADPSNYTQDDIDWDYMESFMSRFKKLAKNCVERLTSTPDCDILTV